MIGYIRRIFFTMLWLAVAVFLLLALSSYTPNDPSWSHVSSTVVTKASNLASWQGAWISDVLYTLLGVASWWLVIVAIAEIWQAWRQVDSPHLDHRQNLQYSHDVEQGYHPNMLLRLLGYGFLIIGTAAVAYLLVPSFGQGANFLGQMVGLGLSSLLGRVGAMVFLTLFSLLTATFVFNIHWLRLFSKQATYPLADNDLPLLAETEPSQADDDDIEVEILGDTTANEPVVVKTPKMGYLASFLEKIRPAKSDTPDTAEPTPTGFITRSQQDMAINTPLDTQELDAQLYKEAIREKTVSQDTKINPEKAEPIAPHSTIAQSITPQTVTPVFAPIAENLSEPTATIALDSSEQESSEQESSEQESSEQENIDPKSSEPEPYSPQAFTITTPSTPTFTEPQSSSVDTTVTNPLDTNITRASILPTVAVTLPTISAVAEPVTEPAETVTAIEPTDVPNPFVPLASVNVDNERENVSETPLDLHPALSEENFSHESLLPEPLAQDGFAEADDDDFDEESISEINPNLTTDPAVNPLNDLHNEAIFQAKSRAMQTAAYRASLTPVPELSVLDLPDLDRKPSYTAEQLRQMAALLEIKLQEFNVKSTVVNAEPGPVVTRFEVDLAAGIKASKVTGISRDLARSLSMASVRVVEVIPGKPYIGIEVPNPTREMVRLIELLDTDDYRNPNSHISMAMGKDIAGRPVITDLAKAPHMLVAGTTGSGKSVLVNSMLLSILLKYTPEQLRMILIDPKQLELANYGDIPHLLTPVVTDMNEAASALSWCVAEMERRYLLMSLFKVRKLDEFNKKVLAAEEQGHPLLDPLWRPNDSVSVTSPPKIKTLPLIVIVADEFADMIMQVGKQAEELITRLAQKSRAAGIHLILATQRPSVDVITGLIKANIPARAALRVNSKIDSRTILDAGGAEDMLGNGDMLFLGPGQIEPNRVHGAYVSDAEVNRVCDAWRERGAPDYIDNMFDNFEVGSTSGGGGASEGGPATGDQDVFYDEAVAFVLETRKVSASSIQRKFSIGYNRAARLVDAMEESGLVSPLGKNGKREILM